MSVPDRSLMYVLDSDHRPIPIADRAVWLDWLAHSPDRIVRQTQVGDVLISTVFLGLDHAHQDGPPVLFETLMFFHGQAQDGAVRTQTWDQALEAHRIVLADARAVIADERRDRSTYPGDPLNG